MITAVAHRAISWLGTGGEAIDLGLALDGLNDIYGPEIFNNADKQAARYSKHHFPGC